MQPAQSQKPRASEEIKSYYSHLWNLCDKPEKNFKEIKEKFSQIKKVPNEEYVWICRCSEAIIKSHNNQSTCIKLLDTLPWQIKSFQQTWAALPLLHAAVAGMRFEIVDYLIRVRRISPNAINNVGETPLHIAAKSGSMKQSLMMTEFLLKRGADPRIKAQLLSYHPKGNRVIDYWPERSRFKSHTELGKASLVILDQAEALLSEYIKRWEAGGVVVELPPIPQKETEQKQREITLVECPSKLGQGLFSFLRRRMIKRDGYSPVSQEDKENQLPTP